MTKEVQTFLGKITIYKRINSSSLTFTCLFSYILEVNSGSGYQIVYRGAETEAVCDNLNPGTTYQLRVSCISEGGQSDYSDPCTVTTDAISPGKNQFVFSLIQILDMMTFSGCCDSLELNGKPKSNSISVRWGEPAYNGGAPILEYEVEVVSPKGSQQNLVQKNKETQCVVCI